MIDNIPGEIRYRRASTKGRTPNAGVSSSPPFPPPAPLWSPGRTRSKYNGGMLTDDVMLDIEKRIEDLEKNSTQEIELLRQEVAHLSNLVKLMIGDEPTS